MFKSWLATGLVIGSSDRQEADRLITVYTREFGKIRITAKAVRKIASKLYGGTELFVLMELEFINGKSLNTMTDYRILKRYRGIKSDLLKIKTAHDIGAIIDLTVRNEQKDIRIWSLIRQVFRFLDSEKNGSRFRLTCYHYFFWNLMGILGYGPDTDHCCFCGRKLIPQDMAFSPLHGGIKCYTCLSRGYSESEIAISINAVKILRLILKRKMDILKKIKSAVNAEKELEKLSVLYLRHQFPVQLK